MQFDVLFFIFHAVLYLYMCNIVAWCASVGCGLPQAVPATPCSFHCSCDTSTLDPVDQGLDSTSTALIRWGRNKVESEFKQRKASHCEQVSTARFELP